MKKIFIIYLLSIVCLAYSQTSWQQRVSYVIKAEIDDSLKVIQGSEKLTFRNNSADTLNYLYFHLYQNAFDNGSEYLKLQNKTLNDEEKAFISVSDITQDGEKILEYQVYGTVLKVKLRQAVLPKTSSTITMNFISKLPKLILRGGYSENVDITATQWYPKLANYDFEGWHIDQYQGREFYGIFGDFDVEINVPNYYKVVATGSLQSKTLQVDRTIYRYLAVQTHDFAFAADKDFISKKKKIKNGPILNLVYLPEYQADADSIFKISDKVFDFIGGNIGKYPYKEFFVVSAGEGFMEYPMATFMNFSQKTDDESMQRSFIHELVHSWFYGVIGFNESRRAFLDEGFTTWITAKILKQLSMQDFDFGLSENTGLKDNYRFYALIMEKYPMDLPANMLNEESYLFSQYIKGALLLENLSYIIGEDVLWQALKMFYAKYQFNSPTEKDFIRELEKLSGMQLKWFFDYWLKTTEKIDFSFEEVSKQDDNSFLITIKREGKIPMPIELTIQYSDSSIENFYIPTSLTLGNKFFASQNIKILPTWNALDKTYSFKVQNSKDIKSVTIDKDKIMSVLSPVSLLWSSQAEEINSTKEEQNTKNRNGNP